MFLLYIRISEFFSIVNIYCPVPSKALSVQRCVFCGDSSSPRQVSFRFPFLRESDLPWLHNIRCPASAKELPSGAKFLLKRHIIFNKISTPPELLLTNHCIYSIITIRYKVNILFIIKKFDANTTERLCFELNKFATFVSRKESQWKIKECG